MLIEICDDIVELAEQNNSATIAALEKISVAYIYGKHLVFAKIPALIRLCKLQNLGKSVREIYSKIKKHITTQYSLVSQITCRILVTTNTKSLKLDQIYINPCDIIDFKWFEETHLLVENLSDSTFYRFLVDYYKRKKSIKCNYCFYPLQGGGDTIHEVYKLEVNLKQHFCLSIIDSDIKYPNCKIGDTALKLQKYHKKEKPQHCSYYIMDKVREIENLIPFSLLRQNPNQRNHRIFQDKLNLDFSYFDMKDGLLCCKRDQYIYNYWYGQLQGYSQLQADLYECKRCSDASKPAPKPTNCLEVCNKRCIIDGFGQKILTNLLNDNASVEKLSIIDDEDLFTNQQSEWMKIGKIIFEWCCSPSKVRA